MVDTRRLVTLIKIICKQKNIKVDQYGNGWILQLTHQQKSKFVYGYKFPVDESTVQMLCDDKAGLSETLITNHIPCVDHQYVMSPMNWHNKTQISQPLSRAKKLLEIHKSIVIKPDKGTGGENVYKVNNLIELYAKSAIIFARYPALVFAPYYDIQHEYRIVLINQKVTLIYEKVKGKSWKHNLSLGAKAEEVKSLTLKLKLSHLAQKAAKVIGIKYCAVDIIQTDRTLRVLEINSGLMFEKYSQDHYEMVKKIYSSVIDQMFYLN